MEPLPKTFLKLLTAALSAPKTPRGQFATRVLTDQKRLDYLNGEQFGPAGAYWMGRTSDKPKVMQEIAKTFVCDNQIKICVGRHVAAIIGKDPEFSLLSGDDTVEGPLVTEITRWWNAFDAHKQLQELMRMVSALGRASIRVYIPNKFAEILKNPPSKLGDALQLIYFQVISPLSAGPVRDEFGDTLGYYFRYQTGSGPSSETLLEVHTETTVTTVKMEGTQIVSTVIPPEENPIQGDFLMREFTRNAGPMIDQSCIDLQNALNEEWTYMRRDSQLAGFRTVWTTNADDPVDADGNPVPWDFSPANVLSLKGILLESKGQTTSEDYTQPNVGVLLPVEPERFFIPKIKHATQALKVHFNQGWVADESPDSSGESQKQSRKAFDLQVTMDGGTAGLAVKWLVETVLALASNLSGEALPEDLTCKPRLYLDVAQGDLETFKALVDPVTKGLVSLATLTEANPAVTDAAAELERLKAEVTGNIQVALQLVQIGGPVWVALEMLRNAGISMISPELIERMRQVEMADPMPPT